MGRTVAIVWQASFSVLAAVLYFLFVLPRWWELTGATSPTLGTVLRIVAAVLIALAALPVLFTLLRTRKPEFGTPQLALTLRTWSIVGHVLAGVLIAGTAISEIWLSLDNVGQWLFGIYGAAAAVGLLGIAAFYLSFVAELPPPPPKPLKPKEPKQRRRGRKKGEPVEETADETAESAEETEEAEEAEVDEAAAEPEAEEGAAEPEAEAEEPETDSDAAEEEPAEPTSAEDVPITQETLEVAEPKKTRSWWRGKPSSKSTSEADAADAAPSGGLKNRRPSGKAGRGRHGATASRSTNKRK
ncbi:hypothetical protein [Mycobacterium talmoniae]|uniref:Transmembrane protein n=1 Tax=Mycobacterium talmoniae TaxID=1858794 RepID=A0A1S1MYR6_9MYCO|nr:MULTISPECIES: hypothetical protein [Mycobacterium]OHU92352.1 hypothetical protein BKN37_25100 [Mycobacterium talmoniae]TDH49673.1 hypothetical protein E2F47_19855 [Mycobacterium eburneum]